MGRRTTTASSRSTPGSWESGSSTSNWTSRSCFSCSTGRGRDEHVRKGAHQRQPPPPPRQLQVLRQQEEEAVNEVRYPSIHPSHGAPERHLGLWRETTKESA